MKFLPQHFERKANMSRHPIFLSATHGATAHAFVCAPGSGGGGKSQTIRQGFSLVGLQGLFSKVQTGAASRVKIFTNWGQVEYVNDSPANPFYIHT